MLKVEGKKLKVIGKRLKGRGEWNKVLSWSKVFSILEYKLKYIL